MNFIFGQKSDPETVLLSPYADLVLYWEEIDKTWSIAFSLGKTVVHLSCAKVTHEIQSTDSIMIRFPYEDESDLNLVHAMLASSPARKIGRFKPSQSILDKLSQLSLFSDAAPPTIVTNNSMTLSFASEQISKSISTTRSTVVKAETLSLPSEPLSVPALLQNYCEGDEFKSHFYYYSGESQSYTVSIRTSETDYRENQESVDYHESETALPRIIQDIANRIHQNLGVTYFDIDWIRSASGQISVLEWNDSPASSYFRSLTGALPSNYSFSARLFYEQRIVCLATRDDRTLSDFLDSTPDSANYLVLSYEDLGTDWTYSLTNGDLLFHLGTHTYLPTAIYDRGISVEPGTRHFELRAAFLSALDQSQTKIISRPSAHSRNGSKPLQAITTLGSQLAAPDFWLVKGNTHSFQRLRASCPDPIVKSCSGVRSHVVDQTCFSKWDIESLGNLPTLFQSKVQGSDVRVHVLEGKVWAMELTEKLGVDYRYQDQAPTFKPIKLPPTIEEGCRDIAAREANPMMGIDLLREEDSFYCLEANPGPGWSYFFADDDNSRFSFANALAASLATSPQEAPNYA